MSQSIMERLKNETWPVHQQAERMQLEKELVGGSLPKSAYIQYIAQRYLIHGAVEDALKKAAPSDPRLLKLVDERRHHQARAAEDLQHFGENPQAAEPVPGTATFNEEIAKLGADNPIALLGVVYVLEGSTNGARFIARAIRGAYRLEGTDGTRYLDPYGEEQRALWQEFKTNMDGEGFTESEQDAMLEGANLTFQRIMEIDQQIYETIGSSA